LRWDIPGILNIYALIVSPAPAVPSTLTRFPLVVFQQAAQALSTPHLFLFSTDYWNRQRE
jgi:hypothetical protein